MNKNLETSSIGSKNTKDKRNEKTQMRSKENSFSSHSVKFRLIICSLVLFVLALGFNTIFTWISLEKLYIETHVSEYRVIANDLKHNIEDGIYYGKNLENFNGMEKLLTDAKNVLFRKVSRDKFNVLNPGQILQKRDISIFITTLDGIILHSDNNDLIDTRLPDSVIENLINSGIENERFQQPVFTKYQDSYFTTVKLTKNEKKEIGAIVISFKDKQAKFSLDNIIKRNRLPIILIQVVCLIFLFLIISKIAISENYFPRKKISFAIFFVICSAQILSSGYMTYIFKDHFIEINKDNSKALTDTVKLDLAYLLNHGIRMDRLVKMDSYLGRIIESTPELNDITIYDRNHHPLYRATKTSLTDFQNSKNAYTQWMEATKPLSNAEYNTTVELHIDNQLKNYISTNTSRTILFKKLLDVAMDSLTVLVISILLLVEMLILVFKFVEKQVQYEHKVILSQKTSYGVIRPAVFLLLFGIDISISFIPIHMEKLYMPILGFSRETVIGLPISVEFLFVGLAIMISGVWLDRRGWHEPFLGGLILASTGFVYSFLAPNGVHFIISRAVVGLGYGLALMASQGFVITYSDAKTKARGLAHLFAGIYAGSICGGATGAMLAERFGYDVTFLFGSFILGSVIIYAVMFMRNAMVKIPSHAVSESIIPAKPKYVISNTLRFLSNRIVLSLIFFSSLPAAIAAVGFLNYFIPVHLHRLGISQSTIGQVLMIYGICLIYFGPFLGKYVDAAKDKKRFVFLGCILGSISFLTFHIYDGILSAMISILLLGLSSSFVLASQSVYALKLKVTQSLGIGKAIGLFRSTSRIGQMLGPIIFATLFAATNITKGITIFGIFYLLTAIIFILLTQRDKKQLIVEDV